MNVHKLFDIKFYPILFIGIFFILQSCTKNSFFNEYKNVNGTKWHKDSIKSFSFNVLDTVSKNNIYVNLRNNKDYGFSNIFLIVGIEFPNNYKVTDTLEYKMTDPRGNFLGTGFSDIKENKLEYKTNVSFPVKGDYHIKVQQAMRKSQNVDGLIYLDGITDVGLEIKKVE